MSGTKRGLTTWLVALAIMPFMTGCARSQWYKPQPPVPDVPQMWQIMKIQSPVDNARTFELDFGLATTKPRVDYSFWLSELKWAFVKSKANERTYSIVIPNCCNVALPSTTVDYGSGDPRALVQSVEFTQDGQSTVLYLTTSHPLQWSQTTADDQHQTVSLVFTPTA
ncbi:hypothetical protein [Alicyclobacillus fructus]|uniref:hypothetical protein n=1 Tax=Alicyclobacillus fructus TaxID=2816082 RepID=UPI001A907E48|nr:hypothetical protein [Alicyclobacillus fructus]